MFRTVSFFSFRYVRPVGPGAQPMPRLTPLPSDPSLVMDLGGTWSFSPDATLPLNYTIVVPGECVLSHGGCLDGR